FLHNFWCHTLLDPFRHLAVEMTGSEDLEYTLRLTAAIGALVLSEVFGAPLPRFITAACSTLECISWHQSISGMIFWSKISFGNDSVQHAFGMSTMPPIFPCTGAEPSSI